jgi:hypothetical protein
MSRKQAVAIVILTVLNGTMLCSQSLAQESYGDAEKVETQWDEFMHYAMIGRWDLAQGYGEALIESDPNPVQILNLSQSDRYIDSYKKLLLMRGVVSLDQVASKVLKIIEQGRYMERTDTDRIRDEVARLSTTPRGMLLAVERLKDSGEWAIPVMIQALRNPDRREEFANIIWAIPQIGKEAVNPLLVVLQQCKELDIQLVALQALADLRYAIALPYMQELIESPKSSQALQEAAAHSMEQLAQNRRASLSSAALEFKFLAEGYYDQRDSLRVPENQDKATVWFWDQQEGLVFEQVPRGAFDELMSMRSCENALRLNPNLSSAVSLWLSAFFRLEAEGYDQPEYFVENHPDAPTYALSSGPEYLHQVLARSLNNRNQAVSLATIKVLQRNSGQKSLLFSLGQRQPLLDALTYPDREVRFSAALTIGSALPTEPFDDSHLIIPLLAEILQQRGNRYALVIDPDQQRRNQMIADLQNSGMYAEVAGDGMVATAVEQGRNFPSLEHLFISDQVQNPDIQESLGFLEKDHRFAFCPTFIYCDSRNVAAAEALEGDHSFVKVVDQERLLDNLQELEREIMYRNHASIFDQEKADGYAAMAAEVLRELAITGSRVLPLDNAELALISASLDSRPEIERAAIETLGRLDSLKAQRQVAAIGISLETPMDVRLLALNNLSASAKSYGNLLLSEQINELERIATSLDEEVLLRNIAAEAYGALNLPSKKISHFITDQMVSNINP